MSLLMGMLWMVNISIGVRRRLRFLLHYVPACQMTVLNALGAVVLRMA